MAVTDRSCYLKGNSSVKVSFCFLLTEFIILYDPTPVNTGVGSMRKIPSKSHHNTQKNDGSKHNNFVSDISSKNALLYL
jgi:hypothetical protein